jgi:uncharacterized protein (DUF2141 family)
VSGCARIVTPVGGAKDIAPPVILKTLPETNTLHFNEKTIKISFNEYVVLNNPNENIFFSPPLKHSPDYILSGKSLKIKLSDTLMTDRTYNIVLFNAIKDFTEGNALPFYQYTFSTGDFIDSFMVSGKIVDAESTLPKENIIVMLYEDDIDSLPRTKLPTYLTRSSKEGTFSFQHVKKGKYKIFALGDINHNFRYDLPNEAIAFSDSLIPTVLMSSGKTPTLTDSTAQPDTAKLSPPDSVGISSAPTVLLSLFIPQDTAQGLLKPLNPYRGVYKIIYKREIKDLKVRQLYPDTPYIYTQVNNPTRDTLTWYFSKMDEDTLRFELVADARWIDTLTLLPYKPAASRGRGKKESATKFMPVIQNSGELYRPLTLHFNTPVRPVDSFRVMIVKFIKSGNDTVFLYYAVPDTFTLSVPLPYPWEEKGNYLLQIRDSVFRDYNDACNDTIAVRISVKTERDYGQLIMQYTIMQPGTSYIISLLNSGGHTIRDTVVTESTTITYPNLTPGTYKLKAIEDLNQNGRWDTGNYEKKQQPERVFFFGKSIQVRGQWEIEEEWILDKP